MFGNPTAESGWDPGMSDPSPPAGSRTESLDGDLNPQVHVPKAENLLSTAGRPHLRLHGFKPPTTLSRERPRSRPPSHALQHRGSACAHGLQGRRRGWGSAASGPKPMRPKWQQVWERCGPYDCAFAT